MIPGMIRVDHECPTCPYREETGCESKPLACNDILPPVPITPEVTEKLRDNLRRSCKWCYEFSRELQADECNPYAVGQECDRIMEMLKSRLGDQILGNVDHTDFPGYEPANDLTFVVPRRQSLTWQAIITLLSKAGRFWVRRCPYPSGSIPGNIRFRIILEGGAEVGTDEQTQNAIHERERQNLERAKRGLL